MARIPNIEKLSYAELVELKAEVESLMLARQAEEKTALKQQMADMAKQHGFELSEFFGNGRGKKTGKVAVKYRDPSNPDNTWTGRGRTPLWLAEATKKRGVTREDFEV